MPAAYTPSPQIGASDPPLPDGPAANAATHRELLNNRRHLRGATWAVLTWSRTLVVTSVSSSDFAVRVGPIEAVTLRDSANVWRPYFTAGETVLGLAHVEGAPGALAADTWYHVYAWADASSPGSVSWQISTTPPTDSGAPTVQLLWKRGEAANYRYLGAFRTDSAGRPFGQTTIGGRTVYRRSQRANATDPLASNGHRALSVTSGASVTALDLAARIPLHARLALVAAQIEAGSTAGTNDLALYGGTDTAGPHTTLSAISDGAGGAINNTEAEVPLDAAAMGYAVTAGAGTVGARIDVLGYVEG